jgi:hypothetical protein
MNGHQPYQRRRLSALKALDAYPKARVLLTVPCVRALSPEEIQTTAVFLFAPQRRVLTTTLLAVQVNDDFFIRTASGGVVTLVAAACMLILFLNELRASPFSSLLHTHAAAAARYSASCRCFNRLVLARADRLRAGRGHEQGGHDPDQRKLCAPTKSCSLAFVLRLCARTLTRLTARQFFAAGHDVSAHAV